MEWSLVIALAILCTACQAQTTESDADPYFDGFNYPGEADGSEFDDEYVYEYEFGDDGDNAVDGSYMIYEDDDLFTDDFLKALNETDIITPRRIIVPTVYGIIALVGILLNPLAVIIAQQTKNLKYSQRIFLQNLCVASFLVAINIPIPAVYRATNLWYFGTIGCKIHNCISNYTLLAQAYFAVALCYDFALLKRRPNIKEKKRTMLEIVTLEVGWLISLAFSFPMLIFSEERYGQCKVFFDKEEELNEEEDSMDMEFDVDDFMNETIINSNTATFCNIPSTETSFKIWIICSFVFSFLLPVMSLILAYVTYRCLANKSNDVNRNTSRCDVIVVEQDHDVIKAEDEKLLEKVSGSNENNNNAYVTRGTIIAENPTFMVTGTWVSFIGTAYFICWLPLHVYHLGRIRGYYLSLSSCHNVRDYAFVQGYLSALLFPFMTICYCRPTVLKVWRARANINFTKEHSTNTQMVNLQNTSNIQNV